MPEENHESNCCRDLAHTMQVKNCKSCGLPGANCQLCRSCSEKLKECSHCRKGLITKEEA